MTRFESIYISKSTISRKETFSEEVKIYLHLSSVMAMDAIENSLMPIVLGCMAAVYGTRGRKTSSG